MRLKAALLVILVIILALGGYVYSQVRALSVEVLADDLWVIRGMGGNAALLATSEGNIVVDTMTFPLQGERIKALAKELTGQDTVLIINTHYHFDHTHGNPGFDAGTRVIATEQTLQHLNALDADFWTGEAAALKPAETFEDRLLLTVGGKTLELYHPGRGHTDGDLVVLFPDHNVLHMGDLYFNQHYPNIDLEACGTVQGWPATIANVLELPFTRVIPGHGVTSGREGVAQFQSFMAQLAELGRRAKSEDWTQEQMRATQLLTTDAGYDPIRMIVPIGLDRAFVLTRAWEEQFEDFGCDG